MSPETFSREYWSSLEYQESQFEVFDSKSSRISLSLNFVLPTMLRCLMWAALPSATSIAISTRLRSSSVTFGLIETLYLPRLLYWRVSSWVTR